MFSVNKEKGNYPTKLFKSPFVRGPGNILHFYLEEYINLYKLKEPVCFI